MKIKTISLMTISLFVSGVVSAAQPLSFKEVSRKTSEAFCKKMEECASQKIPQNQCAKEMNDLFQGSNDRLPKDSKVQLDEAGLKNCLQNIEKTGCEDLKKAQSISGCEFIQKLSS